jgi:hypothetical protein
LSFLVPVEDTTTLFPCRSWKLEEYLAFKRFLINFWINDLMLCFFNLILGSLREGSHCLLYQGLYPMKLHFENS